LLLDVLTQLEIIISLQDKGQVVITLPELIMFSLVVLQGVETLLDLQDHKTLQLVILLELHYPVEHIITSLVVLQVVVPLVDVIIIS
jgi:hypothetical protein